MDNLSMSDIAIRVENLSKQYRIGGPQARYKTIRESLTEAVQAPFRRLSSVVRGQSSAVSNETIWALKDVSFEVQRGEVVGIIGRNGAGKTTLLKVLSRITEPTEGYAEIHGRVGSLLEVGTGFHPELTGRENIYLNGAILGMKRAEIERKFDEIVDFAEIEKFIDTPVKHYSSGMYVRLAFAVAAHLEPEFLLVDEVLAVEDIGFQRKCLGKMGDGVKEGRGKQRRQGDTEMERRRERELRGEGQFQSFGAQSKLRRRQCAPVCLGALEQCLCLVNSARDGVNDITGDLRWHVLCTAPGTYHGRDAGHGSVHALAFELDTDQAEFGFRPTLMTDSDQSFHLRPFLFRLRRVGVSQSSSEGT
jgi:ABC-type polysaccharide/polyol phosphate transport system ATPase subunit